MKIFSILLAGACVGALVTGCGGAAPYRSGKGNDHLVMYRPHGVEQSRVVEAREQPRVIERREVVYVREPYVYYQPAPAYRVVTAKPAYSAVTLRPAYRPADRYVPVTQYYYYTD